MIGNMPGHIFDLKTQACVHCGLSQYGVAEFPKLQVCIKQMGDDMPTPQEDFWRGDFGNAYTSRNRLDWSRRVPFFEDMIMWTGDRMLAQWAADTASRPYRIWGMTTGEKGERMGSWCCAQCAKTRGLQWVGMVYRPPGSSTAFCRVGNHTVNAPVRFVPSIA